MESEQARGEPPPIIHDLASDAWVMDVTDWAGPVDRDVVRRIGDPLLVCFGRHNGHCPLGTVSPHHEPGHGTVFEIVIGRPEQAAFVRRFRQLSSRVAGVVRRHPDTVGAAATQLQET